MKDYKLEFIKNKSVQGLFGMQNSDINLWVPSKEINLINKKYDESKNLIKCTHNDILSQGNYVFSLGDYLFSKDFFGEGVIAFLFRIE